MSDTVASGNGTGAPGRFFGLPRSPLGKASAWLLVLTAVLMVAVAIGLDAFERMNPQPVIARVLVWAEVLAMFSAGVTGGVALVRNRERSWAVWLAVVVAAAILGVELISMFVGE